jgi:hypothetical protein
MPRKWPMQAARLPSGRVEWRGRSASRAGLARSPERRQHSHQSRIYPGNSDLVEFGARHAGSDWSGNHLGFSSVRCP